MNILLINHYAGSPRHGMEFRPYYLAREWVRAGNNVRILSASYSHIRSTQPTVIRPSFSMEMIDGIEYCWYFTPSYKGNGFGRVMSIFFFIVSLIRDSKSIASGFRPDVVIASSTYPMDIWAAERIAGFSSAKLVYEVHDLWPLSPIELGRMPRWHPFIICVQAAEDFAYRKADSVISMLPKTLDYMVSRGMRADKWAYIPNCVDLTDWSTPGSLPSDTNSALLTIKARSLPVLCYTGTHGLANALDVLLDAAKLLKGQVEVILVGTGPERVRLMHRVADEGLSNVTMLPSVPKAAIPALLDAIDIAFIGWHQNPLYRFGISPNKLMDYMMAAKPIIHSVAAGNDPVSEVGCGITVPPGQPYAIASAALSLVALTPEQRRIIGNKGEAFVRAERTYQVMALKFLKVLESHD